MVPAIGSTPKMTDGGGDEKELRKALQLAVCKIVFDEDRKVGTRSTQGAIAALTELTYQYATKSLVPDLYMFSTHANRKSTISPDDVALVLRKIDPDHLEAFQQQFYRGGGTGKAYVGSKSTTANEKNPGGKRTSPGRRRKRDETDVLLLSSSSSSSEDDDESVQNQNTGQKRKRSSGALSRPIKTGAAVSTIGRKSTKTESLLNKFLLRAESRASAGNKRPMAYDLTSSSSEEDDDLQSKPPKSAKTSATGMGATTAGKSTTSKFSLQPIPFSKKEQSNVSVRSKSKTFLDDDGDDDDSTDDDDNFILGASKSTNRTKENNTSMIDLGKQDLDDDSDDSDDVGNNRSSTERKNEIAPKQSQVAEALANLSSDSGMDEDESDEENEMRLDSGRKSSNNRHRPRIESDDDDD